MAGIFITFEGIEGCGKSTQIKLLNSYLQEKGFETVLTREPGGTAIGDRIRDILLDPIHKKMSPIAEILLYNAARSQHLNEVILPALEKGKIVLSDRYSDATKAYQGAARKLPQETIDSIDKIATGGKKPDLTVLIDLTVEEGLARVKRRDLPDRFEQEAFSFHEKVRKGYLEIAEKEPDRVFVVDGLADIESIHKKILAIVEKKL